MTFHVCKYSLQVLKWRRSYFYFRLRCKYSPPPAQKRTVFVCRHFHLGDKSSWPLGKASVLWDTDERRAAPRPGWWRDTRDDQNTCDPAASTRQLNSRHCRDLPSYTGRTSCGRTSLTSSRSRDQPGARSWRWTSRNDSIRPDDRLQLKNQLCHGYNYDSTSIRRPFDCLPKVIKVTVT